MNINTDYEQRFKNITGFSTEEIEDLKILAEKAKKWQAEAEEAKKWQAEAEEAKKWQAEVEALKEKDKISQTKIQELEKLLEQYKPQSDN